MNSNWLPKSTRRRSRPAVPVTERLEQLGLVSPLALPAVPPPRPAAPVPQETRRFDAAQARLQARHMAEETERLLALLQEKDAEQTQSETPPPSDTSSSSDPETPPRKNAPKSELGEESDSEETRSGGGYGDPFEDRGEDVPPSSADTPDASPPLVAPLPGIPNSSFSASGFSAPASGSSPNLFAVAGLGGISASAPAPDPGLAFGLPMFAPTVPQLTSGLVSALLDKASAVTPSNDAIIAIVDREGNILGVRVEAGVAPMDPATRIFAIDGAVAKARTAAFFSSDAAALTSRTVRFISQSTIAQREVESNPSIDDASSPRRGSGFVAPIGLGGHFPPEIMHTPPVDLFAIEHTNRDMLATPGADRILGTADDVAIANRFNIDGTFVDAGKDIPPPVSFGVQSGLDPSAVSRGIGTLPGGVPLYLRDDAGVLRLVGGIGVFFPGPDGYATHEQNFVPGIGQSEFDRTNAPRVLEAEYIAFATVDPPAELLNQRIDLVGITLESFGPMAGPDGRQALINYGLSLGRGVSSGSNVDVLPGMQTIDGQPVADGWLVQPHDGGSLTSADVRQIIEQGIAEANRVRAAIRLPLASRTRMVFAVTDNDGNVLGLYRMSDATVFSIDVSVAKARNVSYYSDPAALQPIDQVPGVPAGTAFTARTFRFLAEPRYPSGVDGTQPPPFSILNDPGISRATAENAGAALPASAYQTVVGFDAFNPGTNFREPAALNQNGIVFFPGSTPVYKNGVLVGGFGVSGDGVDQDDVVTFSGAQGYLPPDNVLRADDVFVNGVRLPYIKFLRNPRG